MANDLSHIAIDGGLAQLINAWPLLPEPMKNGILAMVQVAGGRDA